MTWIELNTLPHTPAGSQFVLMSNYLNRILIKAPASLHLLLLLPEHVWVSAWFIPQFTNLKLNYRRRQLDCWVFVDLILFQLNSSPGSVFPRPGLWINSFEWNVLNYSCVRGRRPRGGAGYQLENCLHYDRTKTFFKKHFHWKSFVKVRNDENHHLSQGCVLSRISDSRIVPLIVLSLAHFSHLDLLLAGADITDITPESGYLN